MLEMDYRLVKTGGRGFNSMCKIVSSCTARAHTYDIGRRACAGRFLVFVHVTNSQVHQARE